MGSTKLIPCTSFNNLKGAVVILYMDVPREDHSSLALSWTEGTMQEVRLGDSNLSGFARYRDEGAKVLLILLAVYLSHVVHVAITDLVFPVAEPCPNDLLFMKALHHNHAISQ